ncbi:MAG: hypothetical protein GY716_17925 [bacterium]|nr:hypothetical protein [bacterium]
MQRSGAAGFVLNGVGSCIFEGNLAENSGQVPGPFTSGAQINADGCLIRNNVFNSNLGEGLFVNSNANRIQGNVFNGNTFGLYFHTGRDFNSFGDNSAVGNTGVCPNPVAPSTCAVPDVCNVGGPNNTSMGANYLGAGPC